MATEMLVPAEAPASGVRDSYLFKLVFKVFGVSVSASSNVVDKVSKIPLGS